MTVIIKHLLAISLALSMCAGLYAQNLQAEVDAYITAQMRLGRFSGSVIIAKKGQILVEKGYGLANHELDVANTPDTIFRLGSLTKQFTAMAVMMLQERSALNVHDPVSTFLPDYPNGGEITIHHLLSHTSGIPEILGMDGFENIKRNPISLDECIEFFQDAALDFEPGSRFQYSNSGYLLLTKIIEVASSLSYETFITENIFMPLGMMHTMLDDHRKVIKHRADGYYPAAEGLMNAPFINMAIPQGGGGLVSTIKDLYIWDRALYTTSLVSRKSLKQMLTPCTDAGYGYGWQITESLGRLCYRHGGGIEGFVCEIDRFVDDKACIIVLCNFINTPVREIVRDLTAILFDAPYQLPEQKQAVQVPREVLKTYAGIYEIAPGNAVSVTYKDGRLFVTPPGQPPVQIYPESDVKFFVKAFKASMTFTKDHQCTVDALILHMGNRDVRAEKVKKTRQPDPVFK